MAQSINCLICVWMLSHVNVKTTDMDVKTCVSSSEEAEMGGLLGLARQSA